jgi:hypothetical protein
MTAQPCLLAVEPLGLPRVLAAMVLSRVVVVLAVGHMLVVVQRMWPHHLPMVVHGGMRL